MDRKTELLGISKLLLVTVFWGVGFPAIKLASESFGTFYQVGFRFLIAAVTLAVIFRKKLKYIDKKLIKSSLILSVALFLTYVFATKGLEYTTASKAAFFCCTSVVIVPIINLFVLRKRVPAKAIVSIIICTLGIFIISYTKDMGFNMQLGDLICIICACCTALHIVMTERLVKDSDPALMTLMQSVFISIFAFIPASVVEPFPTDVQLPALLAILFMGIFCTALAFYLQTSCQKDIDSTKVGIVFSLEPVNGAIASCIILGETLGMNIVVGGALIFFSLVYSELKPKDLKKLKN